LISNADNHEKEHGIIVITTQDDYQDYTLSFIY